MPADIFQHDGFTIHKFQKDPLFLYLKFSLNSIGRTILPSSSTLRTIPACFHTLFYPFIPFTKESNLPAPGIFLSPSTPFEPPSDRELDFDYRRDRRENILISLTAFRQRLHGFGNIANDPVHVLAALAAVSGDSCHIPPEY